MLGLLSDDMGDWAKTVDLSFWENKLLEAREIAMQSKDFCEVDRLKSAYVSAGLDVRMSKISVELVPAAGFDIGRLDSID
jgi:cysteinyl-tRNA synthetase